MRFEKQAVRAGSDGRSRERRDELTRAATRTAFSHTGALHAVRPVEDDGRLARVAHAGKSAHVDDEVTVAEETSAFSDCDSGLGTGDWGLGNCLPRSCRQA